MNGVAKVSVRICNDYIFKRPVATLLFVRFVDYWKGALLPGALLLFGRLRGSKKAAAASCAAHRA